MAAEGKELQDVWKRLFLLAKKFQPDTLPFASYRAQAFCARVESDVRNTVTAQEAAYAADQTYNTTDKVESDGVTITVTDNTTTVDVTGVHAACTKGTFAFSGSTGEYAWGP